ncbi:MAG: PIN domain-containing protein [Chloroflexota bacterium]|nr:PIN domain-containing protein [Chloroflexota bacterium]MDE2908608.1 PIN domain-containing protein [Chloroflexota bacterium]
MPVIVDSSFVYALFNHSEARHIEAVNFAFANTDELMMPDVVLPELSYLFRRDFGYAGVQRLLKSIQSFDARYVPISADDIPQMHEITIRYASAEFDIVDCCIMAIAERLGITRIATFDRRDFSIYRPRHCPFLELLPSA